MFFVKVEIKAMPSFRTRQNQTKWWLDVDEGVNRRMNKNKQGNEWKRYGLGLFQYWKGYDIKV